MGKSQAELVAQIKELQIRWNMSLTEAQSVIMLDKIEGIKNSLEGKQND